MAGDEGRRLTMAQSDAVSNEQFLTAIFGRIENAQRIWVCGFPESPTEKARWGGRPVKLGESHSTYFNTGICNMYFSVGVIAGPKRRKQHFARMAVLVADDPALDELKAPPSYVLETSPGNHQVGYIVASGGDDKVKCDRIMEEVARRGWCDPSGNNIVRYARLPVGVNTKARETGPFAHRLIVWRPELRYTLDNASAALGIDLTAAVKTMPPAQAGTTAPAKGVTTMAERVAAWRAAINDPNLDTRSYHDALNRYSASLLATSMAAGAVVETLRAEMLSVKPTAEQCMAQGKSFVGELQRWQERYNDIPRAVSTAEEKFGPAQVSVQSWGSPVDLWGKIVAPAARQEFFPTVVSDYAFEAAEVSGFDPGFMAMAAMVALAGSINDGIKTQCKRNDPTFL